MATRVPSIAQVRPGAAASIVLKQDQPTGRQVQGIVQDVLTRGNHPRGVKVRLADGRVGRVQRMVAGGSVGSTPVSELQADLQNQQRVRGGGGRGRSEYRSETLGVRYTDIRRDEDGGGEEPPAEMDLMAFVKQAKTKKGKKGGNAAASTATAAEATSEVTDLGTDGPAESGSAVDAGGQSAGGVVCPVCNDFEGDEAAVAHHVESHFR